MGQGMVKETQSDQVSKQMWVKQPQPHLTSLSSIATESEVLCPELSAAN
jgi:hypothetical protein